MGKRRLLKRLLLNLLGFVLLSGMTILMFIMMGIGFVKDAEIREENIKPYREEWRVNNGI